MKKFFKEWWVPIAILALVVAGIGYVIHTTPRNPNPDTTFHLP